MGKITFMQKLESYIKRYNITDDDMIQDIALIILEENKKDTKYKDQLISNKIKKYINTQDISGMKEYSIDDCEIYLEEYEDYMILDIILRNSMFTDMFNTLLTERESKILYYRFKYGLTLEEVGKIYGLTRDRIRQIEAKALRKLRMPYRAYKLGILGIREYL